LNSTAKRRPYNGASKLTNTKRIVSPKKSDHQVMTQVSRLNADKQKSECQPGHISFRVMPQKIAIEE